jgi:predicted nicotinamide N-methyase
MLDDLVLQAVRLPTGVVRFRQPRESAELPDAGAVEWAPIAPYWSVLWRSGMALARELDGLDLGGRRVVELGCGLGLPSLAAARAGATVLGTDADPDALELLDQNADLNGVSLETARVDWRDPGGLVDRGPFDLVLAADVMYERESVPPLLALLPRLGTEMWIADPGRVGAPELLAEAAPRWHVATTRHDVVEIHRLSRR